MKVVVSPQAERHLRKLSKIDQIILARKITGLSQNTHQPQTEKLKGYKDTFRVRVGDYRVVYRRFSDRIYIILIGHRRDIYELLNQLIN